MRNQHQSEIQKTFAVKEENSHGSSDRANGHAEENDNIENAHASGTGSIGRSNEEENTSYQHHEEDNIY